MLVRGGKGGPLSLRRELEQSLCSFQGGVNHKLWSEERLVLLSFGDGSLCCPGVKHPGDTGERSPWGLGSSLEGSSVFGGLAPGGRAEVLQRCRAAAGCLQRFPGAAKEKRAHKTAASAQRVSAQGVFNPRADAEDAPGEAGEMRNSCQSRFPLFTPFPSSIRPPSWFALHRCYELALQKQMATGGRRVCI